MSVESLVCVRVRLYLGYAFVEYGVSVRERVRDARNGVTFD